MRLIAKEFESNESTRTYTFYGFGDLHVASRAFEPAHFKRVRKRIEDDPDAYAIGLGDLGDCINTRDPRFDPRQLRSRYRDAIKRLAQEEATELKELLEPIKHKILGLCYGGHEYQLLQRYEYDLIWELCNSLGIPNLGDTALIRLTFKRTSASEKHKSRTIFIFVAHGYGNSRKWGGRINKISDLASGIRADIYMLGHMHSHAWIKEADLIVPTSGTLRLINKPRVGICVPSFYRTYQQDVDTYAARKLYMPSALGIAGVRVALTQEDYDFLPA